MDENEPGKQKEAGMSNKTEQEVCGCVQVCLSILSI